MTDEDAFIRAILQRPTDDALRLVYADWLEEHGDPRAEYLRLECKLAGDNSKAHQALRARREELRRQVDLEWAVNVALSRITVIEDLVLYLRYYHRSLSETPAMDPDSLPADLPHGLALVYRELGGLFDLAGPDGYCAFGRQDYLYPPGELERLEGGLIRFACENQGNWTCRCALGQEDPPVYSNAPDLWEEEQKGFQIVCDSLNHFLITLCLQEAVFSSPVLVSSEPIADTVSDAARPLWLDGVFVEAQPTHNFYDVPGKDLLILDYPGHWVGTHDEPSLRHLKPGVKYRRIH